MSYSIEVFQVCIFGNQFKLNRKISIETVLLYISNKFLLSFIRCLALSELSIHSECWALLIAPSAWWVMACVGPYPSWARQSRTSDRGDEINTAQTARQPETGGCQDLFKFSEGKLGLDINGNLSIITRGASHLAAVHRLEAHFHRNFRTLDLFLEEHCYKFLVVHVTISILVGQ